MKETVEILKKDGKFEGIQRIKMGEILNQFRKITVKGLKNVRNKLMLKNSGRTKLLMDTFRKKW